MRTGESGGDDICILIRDVGNIVDNYLATALLLIFINTLCNLVYFIDLYCLSWFLLLILCTVVVVHYVECLA